MKWAYIAALVGALALVAAIVGGVQGQTGEAELLRQIATDLRAIADGTCLNRKICASTTAVRATTSTHCRAHGL